MTSTSSKAGIKRSMNCVAFKTNHLALNRMCDTPGEFLSMCFTQDGGLFTVTSTLWSCSLFQTFIFPRKLPNLLMELWGLFYHSYFDKQGLNFTRFGSKITKYSGSCITPSILSWYYRYMHRCQYAATKTTDLFMEQKRSPWVFTALENNNFCVDRCNFFAFDWNNVTYFTFVHIGEWLKSASLESMLL